MLINSTQRGNNIKIHLGPSQPRFRAFDSLNGIASCSFKMPLSLSSDGGVRLAFTIAAIIPTSLEASKFWARFWGVSVEHRVPGLSSSGEVMLALQRRSILI